MTQSLRLYRDLVRTAARLPVGPVQRKLRYNTRQLFDLYRSEQSPTLLAQLHQDAEAAIVVIEWFNNLPQACTKLCSM